MDLDQLHTFLEIVRLKSFSKAAQSCYRTQPAVSAQVRQLEQEMDAMNEELPALRSFVLPGGTRLNAELHTCRTICRRAERITVALARVEDVPEDAIRYLNRLSDALFVYSRWANHVLHVPEVLWTPNEAAGAKS